MSNKRDIHNNAIRYDTMRAMTYKPKPCMVEMVTCNTNTEKHLPATCKRDKRVKIYTKVRIQKRKRWKKKLFSHIYTVTKMYVENVDGSEMRYKTMRWVGWQKEKIRLQTIIASNLFISFAFCFCFSITKVKRCFSHFFCLFPQSPRNEC